MPTRTVTVARYIVEKVGICTIGERGMEGMSFG